ncbi:hypothetical protein P775_06550 [Puniceibacterium antarcticum]|uniref:DDE domain-containing protein n=1 Tax=Puniceibacterium antarcticum TaxID=1206336 RepID=A0A2G8RHQ6_9RHOB|nr:hypothetical protein P775_06550 [Puniceibacterium antarcticum]
MPDWSPAAANRESSLRSYGAALRKVALDVDHRAYKGFINRIEGSHRPTRKREKIQDRFKSARKAKRFLTLHYETANLFRAIRHKMTATSYCQNCTNAFYCWSKCAAALVA